MISFPIIATVLTAAISALIAFRDVVRATPGRGIVGVMVCWSYVVLVWLTWAT
ncbi:MAG: hypothetical protein KIT82_19665 [Bradyrhizobium sp.]|nr:hypothetical protein [Bradyrhizobium sp.]